MRMRNVCEGLNEYRASVETLCTLDSRMACFMDDLLIQLIQGLDVITGESYGNEYQVCLTFLDIFLNSIARLCTQPGRWSDLGLPT